jgi:hypothetical protein
MCWQTKKDSSAGIKKLRVSLIFARTIRKKLSGMLFDSEEKKRNNNITARQLAMTSRELFIDFWLFVRQPIARRRLVRLYCCVINKKREIIRKTTLKGN